MGLGEESSREMDVAHHNVPVHVEVGDPARGFGSLLRILVSQLKLRLDRGVAVSIDVRTRWFKPAKARS
jgi:hypothetical protein